MTNLFSSVMGFFKDVFTAIVNLSDWIGQLATSISSTDFSTTGITLIMGNFRYLTGDVLYLALISSFYIGIFMIAFKTIPIIVSWFKHFIPI